MRRLIIALTLACTALPLHAQPVAPPPAAFTVSTATPFPGAVWAVPSSPARHPVIIVLGGSEGGDGTARTYAPLFAAQGYATLGLPYYEPGYDPAHNVAGLPQAFQNIPVDRLETVRAWLAKQPTADRRRIGVWGASKGAEFALIAASRYPWIKAVAAIVPSDVVWEGWGKPGPSQPSFALHGKPLPYLPYWGMEEALARVAKGQPMELRRVHDEGRQHYPERLAAARIPVERIRGPVLVAGGGQDAIWPSLTMAEAIARARTTAYRPTVLLTYPDAGHALSGPHTKPGSNYTVLGGEPAAIERAQEEVWAATLKLFADALRPGGTSARSR